jgi:hypothetical protein
VETPRRRKKWRPRRSGCQKGSKSKAPSKWCNIPSANVAKAETEPTTFEEAMRSGDANQWKLAMDSELESMRELGVWTEIARSGVSSVIPCRYGTMKRHKARLVAKGFEQRSGADFNEVWAPVSRHATVWTYLATVAHRGWEVNQVDVTTAFIYNTTLKARTCTWRCHPVSGSQKRCASSESASTA